MDEERIFRFRAGGVECDGHGPRVANFPLLVRDGPTGWRPRPAAELASALTSIFGIPIDVSSKLQGLATVAGALNENDIARAQIATLLLKLPDPQSLEVEDGGRLRKFNALFEAGWIGKDWDLAKHPRAGEPPNPGWFAPTGGSGPESGSEVASPAKPGGVDGASIIHVGAEEDERFPWEQREQDEGGTYFNPDTGKTQELPSGSGVTLGHPWIRIPDLPERTYLRAPESETWVSQESLQYHFDRHGDDFGARDEEDYASKANKFYLESESRGYQRKVQSDGSEYIYDPKTNTFGMYTIDGKTITFYKPTLKNYFEEQSGFRVKEMDILDLVKTERAAMESWSRFMCPVCGYPGLNYPPHSSSGSPSHEICPCCGFHFGYDDDDQGFTYEKWRHRWIMEKKLAWWSRRGPPPNWSPAKQLGRLARTEPRPDLPGNLPRDP